MLIGLMNIERLLTIQGLLPIAIGKLSSTNLL